MGPGNDQVACSAPCTDPSQTASQQGGGAGHCVLLETNGSRNSLPPVILSGKPRCVPCSRACPRCPRHHTPIGRGRTLPFETLGTGVDLRLTGHRSQYSHAQPPSALRVLSLTFRQSTSTTAYCVRSRSNGRVARIATRRQETTTAKSAPMCRSSNARGVRITTMATSV